MPTASKLVAAILFAGIALVAAELFKPEMPEGMVTTNFVVICALVGLACGWVVMGRLVGGGILPSAGHGFRTSVTIFVWVLAIFSIREMFIRSTRLTYDNPIEAIANIFKLMGEYALTAATVPVLGTLIIGGLIAGALAEMANRRWR